MSDKQEAYNAPSSFMGQPVGKQPIGKYIDSMTAERIIMEQRANIQQGAQGEIPAAIQQMDKEMNALEDRVRHFLDRLEPIMRPEQPQAGTNEKAMASKVRSEMAGAIILRTGHIVKIIDLVTEAEMRLDL